MNRPLVMVFAGLDPSGGAGISADIEAIGANGAHALPIVTALTIQDNNRVHGIEPVNAELLLRQARVLMESFRVDGVKIGIPGNRANAEAIRTVVLALRERRPALPVVLDPVLSSGAGDPLARGNAVDALLPLLDVATLLVPNLPEAAALPRHRVADVLVTGGHAASGDVRNSWHSGGRVREWTWSRLAGEFHGSGCTLASAIAARLACGDAMEQALERGQLYTHSALTQSFAPGPGQRIPLRLPQAA
jgi:hydroxymethylpyrimidine/phosphomethylpyrimidine kinase